MGRRRRTDPGHRGDPRHPEQGRQPDAPRAASLGVTLDGVLIESSAPIDLILGNYTIGAFDPCGGHVNPQEGYHMHATTGCSDADRRRPRRRDGDVRLRPRRVRHPRPVRRGRRGRAGLDECNGHETDELGYHYHANQVAENAVLTCFSGETAAIRRPEAARRTARRRPPAPDEPEGCLS